MAIYVQPAGATLPIVSNRFSAIPSRALLFVALFGLPLTMACVRAFETPPSLLGYSRIFISLAAVTIVMLARRRNLAQRLLLAFLLEAASGIATLAFVDVPFVLGHVTTIAGAVASSYQYVTHRNLQLDLRALPIAP